VGPAAIRAVSPAVNKVAAIAQTLEIPVFDDRLGPSGRIWFQVHEVSNVHIQKLARKLLELGFTLQPGKGYWR